MLVRARTHASALWLLVASMIGNVLAYGYQVVMARLLRPEDYAILTALFGIILVEAIGAQVIQSATARIAANYRARDEEAALHVFVRRWTVRILLGAGIPALLIVVVSPLIAPVLSLPLFSVALLGVTLFLAACVTFTSGLLQGLGRFGWLGWNLIAQAGGRLTIGVALVLMGFGVNGAFVGAAAALAIGVLAAIRPLAQLFRSARAAQAVPALGAEETRFFLLASLVLLAYAALTNMDAVIGRAILPPEESGAYAGAITMGKIVLFAPIAVGFILLERTARAHARGDETERGLLIALAFVLVTSGGVALAYVVAPAFFTSVILGNQYAGTAAIIPIYGFAALSNALLTLWNAYFIGRGEMRVGAVFAVAVVVQAILLLTLGANAQVMARIVLGVSLAMQVVAIVSFVASRTRR